MPYRRTENVVRRLAERERTILDAAQSIASESGMGAVQIAPVAHRADIAAGTVYRYFPSKNNLIAEVIASAAGRELAAMREKPVEDLPGGKFFTEEYAKANGLWRKPGVTPEFDALPAALASHTSEHADFAGFAGRSVVVVGAGQSALESAVQISLSRAPFRSPFR